MKLSGLIMLLLNKFDGIIFDLHSTLATQEKSPETHILEAYKAVKKTYSNMSENSFLTAWKRVDKDYNQAASEGALLVLTGQPERAKSLLKEFHFRVRFENIFKSLNIPPNEETIYSAEAAYQRSWVSGLHLPIENIELLKRLSVKYKIALVSNFQNSEVLKNWLRSKGVLDVFKCIVISEEFGIRKPHPSIFQAAIEKLELHDYSKILSVGDNPIDDLIGPLFLGMGVSLLKYSDNASFSANIFSLSNILQLNNLTQ